MQFFIPFAEGRAQTERLLGRIEANLIKGGFDPLKKFIYKVEYSADTQRLTEVVGEMSPQNSEIVMAIVANDRGYLICTYSRGAAWGIPIIAHYKDVSSVTSFDIDVD